MLVNLRRLSTYNIKIAAVVTMAVLAMHALVAVWLVLMPNAPLKPVTITTPIEIEFVTSPKPDVQPLSNQPIQISDDKPTPVKAGLPTDSQPPVKTHKATTTDTQLPIVQSTPTGEAPLEPTVSEPTAKDATVASTDPIIIDNRESKLAEPFVHMVQPDPAVERLAQQQVEATAQADREKAERETIEKAQREANERAKVAKQQAQREAQRAKAEQARVESEQAEKQQAEPSNNKPVNFGSGDARWKNRPNIKLTGNLAKIAQQQQLNRLTVQLSVAVNGSITSITIVESSGNIQIDQFIEQRLRLSKLQPFTQNSKAVAGTVTLPIQIQ